MTNEALENMPECVRMMIVTPDTRSALSWLGVRTLTPHTGTGDPIVIVRRLTLVSTVLLFLGTLNAELGTCVYNVTRGHNIMVTVYRDSPGS